MASGHCSSDQGTIVWGTRQPRSKSWAWLGSILGLQRLARRGWEGESGAWGGDVAPARGYAPQPQPHPQPWALSAIAPSCDEKSSSFLRYISTAFVDALYLLIPSGILGPTLPLFPLLLLLVAFHSGGLLLPPMWLGWEGAQAGGSGGCSAGTSPFPHII